MPNKKQIKPKSRFKNSILSNDILRDSPKKTSKTETNIPTNTEQNLYELVFDKESSTPSNNKKSTKMVPKVTLKKRSKATPTLEKKNPLKTNSIQKTSSLVTSKIKPIKRDKKITNDSLSNKTSNIKKSTAVRINNNGSVKTKKTSNSVSTKKPETKVSTEKKRTVLTKAKVTKLNSENNIKKSTITIEPKKPIKKSKPKIIVSKAKVKLVQFEKKSSKKGSTKTVRLVNSDQNKNSKTSNHEAFKSEAEVFANNYFSMIEEISSFYISSWFDWFIIKE